MSDFVKFLILGLAAGGAYAVLGLGLVLAHRGSGLVNFAHGAIGLVGVVVYYELLPMGGPVAALAGVAASALCGVVVQLAILRPMKRASPLMRVVATLAVLAAIEQAVYMKFGSDDLFVKGLFPTTALHLGGGIVVGEDSVLTLAVTVALALVLWVVYGRTRFGIATTAVAENERGIASLGWSPPMLALVNWAAAGALAGIAGILLAPVTGLSPEILTLVVVPALAAAVVGSFSSFPLTLFGGLIIGALESETTRYISGVGWPTAVPFLAIILMLVVRGRSLPLRGHLGERLPSIGSGRLRLGWAVVGVIVMAASLMAFTSNWAAAVTTGVVYGLLSLSLVVVVGLCGQLSLAQFAIAGIGALISTRLAATQHLPFLLAVLIGMVATTLIGVIVALPAIRVRGINLAVVTLGMAVVVTDVILANPSYTGGVVTGTVVSPPSIGGFSLYSVTHPQRYTAFGLVLVALAALIVANLRRGSVGRRMIAVRGNERAAASTGINVAGVKLYAFAVGAAIAAVGGMYLAFENTNIDFSPYDIIGSIDVLLIAVVGGIGHVGGAIFATGGAPDGPTEQVISHFTSTGNWYLLIVDLLTIVVLIAQPNGIVPGHGNIWRRSKPRLRVLAGGNERLASIASHLSARKRRASLAEQAINMVAPSDNVAQRSLEVVDLTVAFGGVRVLDRVSLEVAPGTIVGLIGPNGAGKTTLIDATSGMLRTYGGTVKVDDEPIDSFGPAKRARAGLVRSFQSLELFEDLTVLDNLLVAAEPGKRLPYVTDLAWPGAPRLSPRARMAIEEFQLADVLGKKPSELSYGQRRLVAIARAVAVGGSVLLLDEPAAGLDQQSRSELAILIRRLADDWGMSVLLVEHDVNMVLSICDEVVVINFGRKIACGPPNQVRHDRAVIEAYLGASVSNEGHRQRRAAEEDVPTGSVHWAVRERSNGERDDLHSSGLPITAGGSTVVETKNLALGYGRIPVVSGLDITVRAGEVVALVGANGAGKTTTILGLAGELPPLDGDVSLFGQRAREPLHVRAKQGLALLPEERSVIMGLTVRDNLRLGRGAVDAALEYSPELKPILDRPARLLSGGELQILAISRALSRNPSLLLADEVSLGLAPLIVERLFTAIRKAADSGVGVLLVEQNVRTTLSVADRVYVLRRGQVILQGTAAELASRDDAIEAAYMADALDSRAIGE